VTDLLDMPEIIAAVDLVGRSGARSIELGYLHDNVPVEKADWWASANYKGTKIQVEHAPSPIAAAEALALRLLTGAKCAHCQKLVALEVDAAFAYFHATLMDGTVWNAADAAAAGQCHWHRDGERWVRGCEAPITPLISGTVDEPGIIGE